MKRTLCLLLALMSSLVALHDQAQAHIFVTDTSGETGVIIHATPDDDPVAGELTTINFDVQDKNLNTLTHAYVLFITNADNWQYRTRVTATGETSVMASVYFQYQGTYMLELYAYPQNRNGTGASEPVIFRFSQAVTRGAVASPLDQPRYPWAEFGLLASLCAIVVLIVVVISRRKVIAGFTTWK